jgi:hypothetical protein
LDAVVCLFLAHKRMINLWMVLTGCNYCIGWGNTQIGGVVLLNFRTYRRGTGQLFVDFAAAFQYLRSATFGVATRTIPVILQ